MQYLYEFNEKSKKTDNEASPGDIASIFDIPFLENKAIYRKDFVECQKMTGYVSFIGL
jgi:hypothetical protein